MASLESRSNKSSSFALNIAEAACHFGIVGGGDVLDGVGVLILLKLGNSFLTPPKIPSFVPLALTGRG
jgi:hypothetical protein